MNEATQTVEKTSTIPKKKKNQRISTVKSNLVGFHDCGFVGHSLSTYREIKFFSDFGVIGLTVACGFFIAEYIRLIFGFESIALKALISVDALIVNIFLPLFSILTLSITWGHYSRVKTFWDETLEIIKAVLYTGAFSFTYSFFMKTHSSRIWMLISLLLLLVVIPLSRYALRHCLKKLNMWDLPLILVGNESQVQKVTMAIEDDPSFSSRIAVKVWLADTNNGAGYDLTQNLYSICKSGLERYPNAILMLAFENPRTLEGNPEFMRFLVKLPNKLILATSLGGLPQTSAAVFSPPSSNFVFLDIRRPLISQFSKLLKRSFDIVISSILLLLLFPIIATATVLIAINGDHPIFGSSRIGAGGKNFRCLKFRSMKTNSQGILKSHLSINQDAKIEWESSFKLKNDPRITRVGAFLRKTSIDELPQLLNVIKGDMSLVGPRPILPEEIDAYGADFEEYIETRPGITGLWQVSGRSNTSYERRIELNRWYQRNWSFWLDIVILLKTIPAVLKSEDAY